VIALRGEARADINALHTAALDEQEESDLSAGSRLLRLPIRSSVPARPARLQLVLSERLGR
jgi:hypothetical protein